jgi:hypothetical protein
MRSIILILFILLSRIVHGQLLTIADYKENQELEKKNIIENKVKQIEVSVYEQSTKLLYNKLMYLYNSSGILIKTIYYRVDRKGNASLMGEIQYTYNSEGVCDSITNDDFKTRRKNNCLDATNKMKPIKQNYNPKQIEVAQQICYYQMYPTCYNHKNHKRLEDGLKIKSKSGHKTYITIYLFK